MAKNFLNLERDLNINVHKIRRLPNKLNLRRSSLRYGVIKMSKIKDRISKGAREKTLVTYKGTPRRLSVYFSSETL